MTDSIAEVRPPSLGHDQPTTTTGPPLPNRRPRVREVSSRFMSPMVSSSSCSSSTPNPNESHTRTHHQRQQQRSKSAQRDRHESEPLRCADENIPETYRSFEAPATGFNSKAPMSTQRKPRAVAKLFKENGGGRAEQTLVSGKSSRPDTPIVPGTDRVIPSRFRSSSQAPGRAAPSPSFTAAEKLLQSSGLSFSTTPSNGNSSSSSSLGHDTDVKKAVSCPNSPLKSITELRSSTPEADLLPIVSNKLLSERNCSSSNGIGSDSSKCSVFPCSRSLNLTFSGSERSSLLNSLKPSERSTSMVSKSYANSVKMGSLNLPPVPPCVKLGTDSKKVRHQEEVHSLKMLHNHHMQWRYANARAEASMNAQRREAEKTIYSLGNKISDLRNGVERKHIELGMLQRSKALSTILEAHMPYLDEWSALEEEFSSSLSGASQALLNASIQLPVNGNVHVDMRELGEALNSANKMMERISFHVQSFMPKAEEMDTLISDLARVTSGERTVIEECGHLLFKTHKSQVEECSLRGHLIQRNKHSHPEKE